MGQLSLREVRLLIFFSLTVLVLGTFFLYEWYSRALADVNASKINFQAERTALLTMKQQQNEYNQKRVWLNQHQPIARDEFEAKEVLDRVVSVQGINAAGLTLVSVPPEKEPKLEPYYWAFERRVIVQGDIQNIVQWLASLQSESSFRSVTNLHIYPKKKKEPESLTCEVTIEQRYATEEILAMSHVGVVPVSSSGTPAGSEAESADGDAAEPTPGEADDEAPPAADENDGKTTNRIVLPNTAAPAPAGAPNPAAASPEVTTPRVRLPSPPKTNTSSPPASSGADKQTQTSVPVSTDGGLLANSARRRVSQGPAAPPPMAGDIAMEARRAAAAGRDPLPVKTGIEPAQEYVFDGPAEIPEPATIRVDDPAERGNAPGPRKTFDTVSVGGIVGEHWDQNTPGAGGEAATVGLEDLKDLGEGPTN